LNFANCGLYLFGIVSIYKKHYSLTNWIQK
jgi:hypothetical protein